MAEDPTMARHWNLMRMLGTRRLGVTVRELARELGVADKTIRRDLDFLRRMGVPLDERTGDYGRKTWRLGESWSKPPLQFDFEEAAALFLGRQLMESMAGTPLWQAAHRAWRKIRSTLGETASDYLDRFSRLFHCTAGGHRDYAGKAEILESLTVAIEDYRAVHISYRSERATEPASRDVYPLMLIRHHNGALYLVAFSPEHDDYRTYKVDRIEAAEVSQLVFQRHRDFDAEAFLERSLGIYDGDEDIAVAIKFLPAAARHTQESRWHKSADFTSQRDGGVILHLQLSSTVEIKSRVLAYGAAAVVLEPESLRNEIAAELERMLEAYRALAKANARDRSGTGRNTEEGQMRIQPRINTDGHG
jgi:predicted DNA-binding transcriptional regulator YafY